SEDGFNRILQVNDYAQEYIIRNSLKGRVYDSETKEPIPFANIVVLSNDLQKGGTTSDFDGDFEITPIPENADMLKITVVGYKSKNIPIGEIDFIEVYLEPSMMLLEEVVMYDRPLINSDLPARNIITLKKKRTKTKGINSIDSPKESKKESEEVIVEEIIIEDEVSVLNMDIYDLDFDEEVEEEVAESVFLIVEEMPEFEGGQKELYKYLQQNINYPEVAKMSCLQGKVYVSFVVGADGQIIDATILKGIGSGCDEEALRVIREMPNWIPGTQRGRNVNVRYVIPINFSLTEKFQNCPLIDVANNANYNLKAKKAKYYRTREFYKPVYKSDEKVEIRTDFRKTIYWNPDVEVDKTGKTTVSFYNSDEITKFRTIIEGIAVDGTVGRKEFSYYTQLPFSMTTKIPPVLTYEDKVSVSITLKNNTAQQLEGVLTVVSPIALKSTNQYITSQIIQPNSTKTIYLNYETLSIPGNDKFQIRFESQGLSDAFEQPIEIISKGFPVTVSFSSNEMEKSYSINVNDLVKGSLKATFTAYPDVLSNLMSGIESILREPYGCFEQVASSTYPNIIALQYMEETGTINSKIREKAIKFIEKGYKKLIAYETKQDGYEWYGHVPPHESLTAYGLMEFDDMEEVYASVDNKMVFRTRNFLLDRRDGNGNFKHTQGKYGFSGPSESVSNAYIVYALTEVGEKNIQKELNKAYEEAIKTKDAYKMTLVANAFLNLDQNDRGNYVLKKIINQVEKHGFGGLKSDHSITRSYGKSLQVETVALFVLALLKSDKMDIKILEKAVNYLIGSRGNYGGFGSTQATILALKALTKYAKFAKRTDESGTIGVYINGKEVTSRFYEKGTQGEIVIHGLRKYFTAGSHKIDIKFSGTKKALPYSMDISWCTYTPNSNPECKVKLQTQLFKSEIKEGETVRFNAILRNTTNEGLPFTVALVGIPSGLSAQPWQLKELQEKGKIDYYEVKKNYIIFYFRELAPDTQYTISLDLKAEIKGDYEAPASSAYLYYTNEFKYWTGGDRVIIK
ncbi:MAG: TonB family protein, partial [Bacteroidetes bacterium]|nr:TonB family protein [Bacteroidota bacterium]